MVDRSIYIYNKNKEFLEFAASHFNGENGRVEYFVTLQAFRQALKAKSPDIVIAGAPKQLESIAQRISDLPVVAVLPNQMKAAFESVVSLGVVNYVKPPFYGPDLEAQMAFAVKSTRARRAMAQEKNDLELLMSLTTLLTSTLNPKEVLYIIVKKISEAIPVSRCSLMSIDMGTGEFIDVISTFEDSNITNLKLRMENYPEIQKALKTKKPVLVHDAMSDPLMEPVRANIEPLGIKSIMVIPVMLRSEVIGTLFLRTSRREYNFTKREIGLCNQISSAAANALNNAYMYEEIKIQSKELERLAITDYLTGIFNVRYLYHRLEEEFSRSVRYKTPLSCIMLDLDHFKRINDTYGHRTGDRVLRELCKLVGGHIRRTDVFARYGGEEFIVLLPQTDMAGAEIEAERLRVIVGKHLFKGLDKGDSITISLGLSSMPFNPAKKHHDLLSLADKALLKAKAAGRNRVVKAG